MAWDPASTDAENALWRYIAGDEEQLYPLGRWWEKGAAGQGQPEPSQRLVGKGNVGGARGRRPPPPRDQRGGETGGPTNLSL